MHGAAPAQLNTSTVTDVLCHFAKLSQCWFTRNLDAVRPNSVEKAGYAHMDFTVLFLHIKEAISKRFAGHSLGLAGALKTGLSRGVVAVALTGVLFVGFAFIRGGVQFKPGYMPQCESLFTRGLLTKVINESIAAQQGIKLLQVDEVADFAVRAPSTAGDPDAEFRNCSAFVRTNAGRAILFFQLTWGSRKKDEVWLEITESSL